MTEWLRFTCVRLPNGTNEVITERRRRSDRKGRQWTDRLTDCEADNVPRVLGVGKFIDPLFII